MTQVDRDLIFGRITFVHELLHKLANDVTLRILGNLKVFRKIPNWKQRLVASLPSRNKALVIAAKIYPETDIKICWSFPIFLCHNAGRLELMALKPLLMITRFVLS